MGWNQGFTLFEQQVIERYDQKTLNRDSLVAIMEMYRDTDIDSGGKAFLQSHDGKEVEQIVLETLGHQMPDKPSVPGTEEHGETWDDYFSEIQDQFYQVTDEFGWR